MPDRPILFSAPMVRALLDGRKHQTRRVLKPQPIWDNGAIGIEDKAGRWVFCSNSDASFAEGLPRSRFKMPYAPGDRLWVKEGCGWLSRYGYRYRADDADMTDYIASGMLRWRSPIHMPRRASRLTLTVTEVRVQRLQEISGADAMAEGVQIPAHIPQDGADMDFARREFRTLWNSLHGPEAWDANPWVVALTFTVRKGNIDDA